MNPQSVAVLGCGPAGLLAAHAVATFGHEPVIFAKRAEMSPISGAQFVHEPIPEVTTPEPESHIAFARIGSREGYASKVYGDPLAPCSWDAYATGRHPAWSMAKMYARLWELYSGRIAAGWNIEPSDAEEIERQFPLVISTIPARALCSGAHSFRFREVWIREEHRDICEQIGDPCVIYNGQASDAYYRTSLLFGHGSTEFSHPVPDAKPGVKPLDTDCDCLDGIVRAGRFGEHRKGVLVHHAYRRAAEAVTEHLGVRIGA